MPDLTSDTLTLRTTPPSDPEQAAAFRYVTRTATAQGWAAGDLERVLGMLDRGLL